MGVYRDGVLPREKRNAYGIDIFIVVIPFVKGRTFENNKDALEFTSEMSTLLVDIS